MMRKLLIATVLAAAGMGLAGTASALDCNYGNLPTGTFYDVCVLNYESNTWPGGSWSSNTPASVDLFQSPVGGAYAGVSQYSYSYSYPWFSGSGSGTDASTGAFMGPVWSGAGVYQYSYSYGGQGWSYSGKGTGVYADAGPLYTSYQQNSNGGSCQQWLYIAGQRVPGVSGSACPVEIPTIPTLPQPPL